MPLIAPTDVQTKLDGTTDPSVTAVVVTWVPGGSAGVNAYFVERSDDGGSTWNDAVRSANITSFRDSAGLASGTVYNYRVTAAIFTGNFFLDDQSVATAPAFVSYIDAPDSVTASPPDPPNPLALEVSWPDVTGATRYRVERTPSQSNAFGLLATADAAPYTDDLGIVLGNEYTYGIRAENDYGTTRLRTSAPAPIPPTFWAISDPSNPTTVNLSWDSSNYVDVSHFNIGRSVGDALSFDDSFAPEVTGSTHSDSGMTPGTVYYYRIQAVTNTGVHSEWSNPITAQAIGTPGSVTVTPTAAATFALIWTDVLGAEVYDIKRQRGTNAPVTAASLVVGTGYPDVVFADVPGQEYTWFVRAGTINTVGSPAQSPWTATSPGQFSGEQGTVSESSVAVQLTWLAGQYTSDHTANLKLEKSEDNGDTWSTVEAALARTATSYDTSIPVASTVLFRLSTVPAAGAVASWPNTIAVTSLAGSCTHPLDLGTLPAAENTRRQSDVEVDDPTSLNNFLGGSGPRRIETIEGQPGYRWLRSEAFLDKKELTKVSRVKLLYVFDQPGNLPVFTRQGAMGGKILFQPAKWVSRPPLPAVKAEGPLGAASAIPLILPNVVYINYAGKTINGDVVKVPEEDQDYFPNCRGFPYNVGVQYVNQPWYIVRKEELWYLPFQRVQSGSETPDRITFTNYLMGPVPVTGKINPTRHVGVDHGYTGPMFVNTTSFGYSRVRISYYLLITCHVVPPPPPPPLTSRKAVSAYENGQKASPATGFVLVETTPRVIDVGLAAPQLGNLTLHKGQGWRIVDHGGAIISVDGATSGDVDADGVCLNLPASVTIHNYEAQADVGQPHVASVEFAFTVEISSCTDWPSVTQADVFNHGSNWANWWWDYFYNFTPSQSARYYTNFPEHPCG